MTNQLIGYLDCPHCGKEVALRESKKGKAYYTCPDCGQFFSRAKGADEALRAKVRPEKAAPVEKKEEPVEAQKTTKGEDNGKTSGTGFWNRPL